MLGLFLFVFFFLAIGEEEGSINNGEVMGKGKVYDKEVIKGRNNDYIQKGNKVHDEMRRGVNTNRKMDDQIGLDCFGSEVIINLLIFEGGGERERKKQKKEGGRESDRMRSRKEYILWWCVFEFCFSKC